MPNNRCGFTMLEAVVALAIVGVVCIGILAANATATRADVTAANRLPLSALAQERLAAIDIEQGGLDRLPDTLAHGRFQAPYERITWDVQSRPVSQIENLYDITVNVRDNGDVLTVRTRRFRRNARDTGR